jgi:hypothetical protein
MQLTNYMSRKDVRSFLREKAKDMTKLSNGNTIYYVKSMALLAIPRNSKKAKPSVIYDHNAEKRKVGS